MLMMNITMLLFIYLMLFFMGLMLNFFFFFKFLLYSELMKLLPPLMPLLLLIALFTLFESKILGSMQESSGPNIVGFWGILQPFADAFKLMFKETVLPGLANIYLFILSPIFIFTLSLLIWAVIPFSYGVVLSDINLGLMFIFSISSLSVYGIIISGWASNSKYAFLGSLSSSAQFISYEVSLGMIMMSVVVCMNTMNLTYMSQLQENLWFFFPLWPSFLLFFIAALAETNSMPFDLPEAESELVSGYNVEYSATTFVLFFLAEYSNILMMSCLIVILFFGAWNFLNYMFFFLISYWIIFSMKVCCILCLFIVISATLPSYRYDQLMNIGWKILLPLSLAYLFFISVISWLFF